MANDEVKLIDIIKEEGLCLSAIQLETLHPDLNSASLTKLLATIILETENPSRWPHKSPEQISLARECQRLTYEAIEEPTYTEEHNFRKLLIIGYLHGQQQSYEKSSAPQDCYPLAIEKLKELSVREDHSYRRIFTIGYQYGQIINPGNKAIKKGLMARIKVMNADMKRSEGGRIEAENRKSAAASRKAKAKKIWDEFIAAGRPERGLAKLVAARMGVSDNTVRKWRRSGWR